jgi:BlaI family transcriptional regulator, penicillinase repressor
MKTKQIVLSDGEWKLMKLLWENAPMTLGDMVEAMQDGTAWSKGTIFTMLRRMGAKGAVRMDDSGKYQQYYPVLQKEEAEQTETRSFLERVYDGSVGMMLSAMAHDRKLSKSEIDELYKIIQNARKEET